MTEAKTLDVITLPADLSITDACLMLGLHSLYVRCHDERKAGTRKGSATLAMGQALGLESAMDLLGLPYDSIRPIGRAA